MKYGLTEAEKKELERIEERATELRGKELRVDPVKLLGYLKGSLCNTRIYQAVDILAEAIERIEEERAEYEREIERLHKVALTAKLYDIHMSAGVNTL